MGECVRGNEVDVDEDVCERVGVGEDTGIEACRGGGTIGVFVFPLILASFRGGSGGILADPSSERDDVDLLFFFTNGLLGECACRGLTGGGGSDNDEASTDRLGS